MTRIEDDLGIVHFRNPVDITHSLCCAFAGRFTPGLFGFEDGKLFHETTKRVTCQDCAKVVCKIRNEPYNTLDDAFDDETMVRGIYAAAEPDGRVKDREVEE